MLLTYPNKIAWRRYVEKHKPFFASINKQKDLANFLRSLDALPITHEYIHPDTSFFAWFTGQYQEMLREKSSVLEFDVANYEIKESGKPVDKIALILFEGGRRIGATLLFNCRRSLNVAFKVYPPRWSSEGTRIGPSLYSEYLLYERAREEEKDFISLGVDRNPYGPNANIGLATYKLSAGYIPRISTRATLEELETDTLTADALVFHPSTAAGKVITEATLICGDPDKYEMLLNQKQLGKIHRIIR